MTPRRPRTAAQSTALPSLAALLASGVAVEGCDSAADGAQRMRRLTDHGQQAARAIEGRQPGEATSQVGMGLGLIGEREQPGETRIQAPGEAPMVRPDPVPQVTGGVPAPVTPEPPDPRQQDVDGGIRHVDPTPPTPPTPPPTPPPHTAGAPMPVQVAPHPPPVVRHPPAQRIQPRGGAPAVRPGRNDDLP